jgi:hypothetical protein
LFEVVGLAALVGDEHGEVVEDAPDDVVEGIEDEQPATPSATNAAAQSSTGAIHPLR